MNQRETLAAIKAIRGMTATVRDGEFRVTMTLDAIASRYVGSRKAAVARAERMASYTNDPADAIGTARAMSAQFFGEAPAAETAEAPAAESAPQFVEFIEIEMNWESNVPLLLALISDGDATGREYARGELIRLAKGADRINATAKAGVVQEYRLKGDGCQAPGAVVLRRLPDNEATPFVVHFRNDQDSERAGKPVYYFGDYCTNEADAWAAFADKIRRYDPSGALAA